MATIIDALLVTLGLDNKDFIDKTKMSKRELAEFEKAAKHTSEEVRKHGEKAQEFYRGLQAAAAAFFVAIAGKGLKQFMDETTEADKATGRMAEALNLSIEELGAWQGAAVMADGSAEGFRDSVKGVAGSLVDIEKNLPRAERALKVFQASGVTGLAIGKKADVLEVFDQLADKMKLMGSFEARRLGERMGLDSGTIRLLKKGKDGIAELKAEVLALGVATQEDANRAEELEDAHKALAMSSQKVGRYLLELVVPAITYLSEKMLILSKWAKEHKSVVQAVFMGLAAAITVAGIAAALAAPMIVLVSFKVMLIAAAVGLLVAGFVWLIQKWKEWIAGGQKATTTLEKFFTMIMAGWNKIREVVLTVMGSLWNLIKDYVAIIMDEFALLFAIFTGDWEGASKAWDALCKDIVKFFKLAVNMVIYWLLVQKYAVIKSWREMWAELKAGYADFVSFISGESTQKVVAKARELAGASLGLSAAPVGSADWWKNWNAAVKVAQAPASAPASGGGGIYVQEMTVALPEVKGEGAGEKFWAGVKRVVSSAPGGAGHVAQAEGR